MNRIEILSKQDLESKYCTAIEVDCDGDIQYPMDTEQIKEQYLDMCDHQDKFIQVMEYKRDRLKAKIDNGEFNDDKNEYLIKWGVFCAYEGILNSYYNIDNTINHINKEKSNEHK
jgi:hypothetical protein